jgi:hypothetical protein
VEFLLVIATKLLILQFLFNLLAPTIIIIIASILNLSPLLLFYYNSLSTKTYFSLLFLLVVCYVAKMLQLTSSFEIKS